MGQFVTTLQSVSTGLGDEWFALRLQRDEDNYWYCYSGANAGTFQLNPLAAERNIPMLETDGGNYVATLESTISAKLIGRVYDLVAAGEPIRAEFTVTLVDGAEGDAEETPSEEDDEDFVAPTLDELQRRFHLYGRYRRTKSSDDALRFIEACQGLLEAKPISSSHGPDALSFTAELRQLITEAQKWIAGSSGVDNGGAGVKHVSFANFRD